MEMISLTNNKNIQSLMCNQIPDNWYYEPDCTDLEEEARLEDERIERLIDEALDRRVEND